MKKIIGILCIVLGLFFALVFLVQIPTVFTSIRTATEASSGGNGYIVGYAFGQAIALLLFAALVFFLLKFGFKWARAKKN